MQVRSRLTYPVFRCGCAVPAINLCCMIQKMNHVLHMSEERLCACEDRGASPTLTAFANFQIWSVYHSGKNLAFFSSVGRKTKKKNLNVGVSQTAFSEEHWLWVETLSMAPQNIQVTRLRVALERLQPFIERHDVHCRTVPCMYVHCRKDSAVCVVTREFAGRRLHHFIDTEDWETHKINGDLGPAWRSWETIQVECEKSWK